MNFANPGSLALLALIPLLYLLYVRFKRRRHLAAIKFSNLKLIKRAMPSKKLEKRNNLLFAINLLSLICLITALADPHIPLEQAREGVNIVLAIDSSGSMAAEDYKPNRLEAAKKSAESLIDQLDFKDNLGIVIFSEGATTGAYLTPFKDNAKQRLSDIKLMGGSTAIGDGLTLAIDMATSVPNKKKVVVLLSDGENNAGVISPLEAIGFAKANSIQVYTIGVGSEKPAVIGYDFFGRPQYASLDEATLIRIAEDTGGEYYKAVDSKTLDAIYERIPDDIEREKEPVSIRGWLIGSSIALSITSLYLRYGRYSLT